MPHWRLAPPVGRFLTPPASPGTLQGGRDIRYLLTPLTPLSRSIGDNPVSPCCEVPVTRLRTRRIRVILSEYFELFLTTVGVLIAIGVTFTELPGSEKGLALTFLVWLQGFIL